MMYTCNQCKKSSNIETAPNISGAAEVVWVLVSGVTTILVPLYFAGAMEDFLHWQTTFFLYLITSSLLLVLFWSLPSIVKFMIVKRSTCPRCGKRDWSPVEGGFR